MTEGPRRYEILNHFDECKQLNANIYLMYCDKKDEPLMKPSVSNSRVRKLLGYLRVQNIQDKNNFFIQNGVLKYFYNQTLFAG